VAAHLVDYLPTPVVRAVPKADADPKLAPSDRLTFSLDFDRPKSIGPMRSFWSNFAHAVRALAYIYANGAEGLKKVSQLAVLNANYIRVGIRDVLETPYDEICRHEFVASAQELKKTTGVRALDIAKALLDKGYMAPTMYFPLIVPECLMIEPTETESKETLDVFVAALRDIIATAKSDPQAIMDAPVNTVVGRVDETRAARQPDLRWRPAATN
jgi:glycine dehydrogenase subunit 2